MRRIAIAAIPLLAMFLVPGGANAARARHALSAKCAPSSHTLLANAQGQVYAAREGSLEYLRIRACAYGQRRSFIVTGCDREESAAVCVYSSHITLVGALIAYENADVNSGRYPELEKNSDEWYVVVQNLRTGNVLHDVPTGAPLKPAPRYVGVGPIVGLVLKSDGSVAWIAEDYERSSTPHDIGAERYFDVYAADTTGTRLLASGASIDPSSLALSVGGFGVGGIRRTIAGGMVYWSQGGKSESAVLN